MEMFIKRLRLLIVQRLYSLFFIVIAFGGGETNR